MNSTSTVLWEPGRATAPATRQIPSARPAGGGSGGSFLGSGEPVVEAPGLVAGVDDVCSVGDAVDDGLGEARVGEDLGPFAEREVGRDDQRCSLVALGDDLEDELCCTVGECEVSELVEDDELGAGVARDDAAELAAALGCLQLVREGGECGEAHAASLLAGEDRERDRQVCLARAGRVRIELLTLLMFCRTGCGWWTRRGSCVMSSWRCLAGAPRTARPP